MAETFTCDTCHRTFDKEWSDEEARAETVEIFGESNEDDACICDDCWREMMGLPPLPDPPQ